jgi:hypothetical protein
MELKPNLPKADAYAKAFVAYSLYGWIAKAESILPLLFG